MATPGVLKWANDIRFSMVNDPARQILKDNIEFLGFSYLRKVENELHSILAAPAEDSAFELLKTPGRNRTLPLKAKPTPSKLSHALGVSLEEHDDKENAIPGNAFQQALLGARPAQDHSMDLESQSRPVTPISSFNSPNKSVLVDQVYSSPSRAMSTEEFAMDISVESAYLAAADLSVIDEDEETDRSKGLAAVPGLASPSQDDMQTDLTSTLAELTSSRTAGSFHSISLGSSHGSRHSTMDPSSLAPVPTMAPTPVELETKSMDVTLEPSVLSQPPASDYAAPLREIPPWRSVQAEDAAALQSNGESEVPIREESPKLPDVKQKAAIPAFPLPEPMPLRKSMRAPRETVPVVVAPIPIPALPPVRPTQATKRASWLTRAKEMRALEAPSDDLDLTEPASFGSLKRKSSALQQGSRDLVPSSSEERPRKSIKLTKGATPSSAPPIASAPPEEEGLPSPSLEEPTGVLDQLRSTVARLTEAQATTKPKASHTPSDHNDPTSSDMIVEGPLSPAPSPPPKDKPVISSDSVGSDERRFSVSDLVSSRESQSKPVFRLPSPSASKEPIQSSALRISPPSRPVFTRPEKVFLPPERERSPKAGEFHPPAFSRPAVMSVGLSPRLPSEHRKSPTSTQDTQQSQTSDSLFDSDSRPAWLPATQDTEFSLIDEHQERMAVDELDDDDDSWPLPGPNDPPFIPMPMRDDTWSTLPSSGQTLHTGPLTTDEPFAAERSRVEADPEDLMAAAAGNTSRNVPGAFDEADYDGDEDDDDGPGSDDAVLLSSLKPTVGLVQSLERTASQSSLTSSQATSQSSQYQMQASGGGFLNSAQKFMSSVLGSSKKSKPEVKSIQLAAAAAKRQQEEKDKKETRLREMENRRQAAIQRKAEEEKTRSFEEERRQREENDRRKKDREELTDKRTLKTTTFKKQDDGVVKKRLEVQKKPSKPNMKLPPALTKSAMKPPSKPLNASTSSLAQSTSLRPAEKTMKPLAPVASSSKFKHKAPAAKLPAPPPQDEDGAQPSHVLRAQMTARAHAQLQASKPAKPELPPSETIELPDIESEYSDSDDPDREQKKKDLPHWAQSPELKRALEVQSTINPDDIFGQIKPLRMEEVFRSRTSRFRARTSSANWTGADGLTAEEEVEYVRRMGFN